MGDAREKEPSGDERLVRQRQQDLELYLRQTPADGNAYLELARIYRDQERHYDAIRVLERAINHIPDDLQMRWELEESQLARALQRLEAAREVCLQRKNRENEENLERCRIEWAVRRSEVCRARLGRNPGDLKLHVVLAEALRDLGQFEESMREAERATGSVELAPQAHLIRGQCFHAINRPLDALSAWRMAALRRSVPAADPIRFAALKAATNVALNLGLYASAERYLAELSKIRPQDASIQETLAKVRQLTIDTDAEEVVSIDVTSEG